jgi:hypothetical protein
MVICALGTGLFLVVTMIPFTFFGFAQEISQKESGKGEAKVYYYS